jgi:FtsZ-binding cell division protein ZapB
MGGRFTKVTNDEASEDEEDSLSYDDLVRMISESDDVLRKKSDKIAEWKRKYSSLLNSYEELKTSHENLKKSHEELQASNEFLKESNEKLKEAHVTLVAHETVKDKVVSCAKCDELKCASCCPSTSNFSCSTSISSCTSDASLILENESLKKEVDCLSKDLAKWFGSHAKFNHCWTSQKFTLNRNGIDYEPKKGKSAFIPKKTIFEKSQVKYNEEDKMKTCFICKKKVEAHHMCKNKKTISFDASYVLRKNANGNVFAKFVGLPISETKRKSIWVPKTLVTNIQGPKQVWVPKEK